GAEPVRPPRRDLDQSCLRKSMSAAPGRSHSNEAAKREDGIGGDLRLGHCVFTLRVIVVDERAELRHLERAREAQLTINAAHDELQNRRPAGAKAESADSRRRFAPFEGLIRRVLVVTTEIQSPEHSAKRGANPLRDEL